jgi:Amt family ammonium transporter
LRYYYVWAVSELSNLFPVISAVCYWLLGYTLAYGEGNPFVGYTPWVQGHRMSHWFFQFVFAATAATLVSGAVAERCNFIAYIIYSAVISGEVRAVCGRSTPRVV